MTEVMGCSAGACSTMAMDPVTQRTQPTTPKTLSRSFRSRCANTALHGVGISTGGGGGVRQSGHASRAPSSMHSSLSSSAPRRRGVPFRGEEQRQRPAEKM